MASTDMDSGMCSVWFTQHVDDPFVVSSKQPYGVFKKQHERCVDHAVGQLIGVRLEERQEERKSF